MLKKYTTCDGELALTLEPADEGGSVVTSPLDPRLITEAETVEEAFMMAHDAFNCLKDARLRSAAQANRMN